MIVTADKLTAKERELLTLLEGVEGWLSRSEIAARLGKAKLNPHEIGVLEVMSATGRIEKDEQVRGITTAYLYRAVKRD